MHLFLAILLGCSQLALSHQHQHISSTPETVEQWRLLTLNFTSSVSYPNPFYNVSFQAIFTSGNRTITRPGYWNGGASFAVRFHGPTLGTWAWSTVCSNPTDAGLHNVSGSVLITPYTSGSNPLFTHGPLRVRGDGRRFEHADGTPFRWLGDTAWMSPDLTLLDTCNAPANASCTSALSYILADRVAKGFTVYQTYFFGETDTWWVPGSNYTRLNASAFEARVDRVVSSATESGLVVALGMGMHSQSVTMPLPALQALAAYTSARYGAHAIVWITAQEVNAPNANASAWEVAARALWEGSADLGVPLTAHMWVGPNASAPFAPVFVYGDQPFHTWLARHAIDLRGQLPGGHQHHGTHTVGWPLQGQALQALHYGHQVRYRLPTPRARLHHHILVTQEQGQGGGLHGGHGRETQHVMEHR